LRIRRLRQHVSEFFRRDWLEAWVAAFGVLAFAIAVFCAFVVVYLIVSFNSSSLFSQASPTFRRGLQVIGIILFGLIAGMAFIGSWGMVGKRIARGLSGRRNRVR